MPWSSQTILQLCFCCFINSRRCRTALGNSMCTCTLRVGGQVQWRKQKYSLDTWRYCAILWNSKSYFTYNTLPSKRGHKWTFWVLILSLLISHSRVCVGGILLKFFVSRSSLIYFKSLHLWRPRQPVNNEFPKQILFWTQFRKAEEKLLTCQNSEWYASRKVWGKPSLDQSALEVFLRH